jgi:hypothetical protein
MLSILAKKPILTAACAAVLFFSSSVPRGAQGTSMTFEDVPQSPDLTKLAYVKG